MSIVIRRIRAAFMRLTFCVTVLSFASTAGAVAMYDASASLTLEVTDISGSLIAALANQSVTAELVMETGDGSVTNTATLDPGGITAPIEIGDIFTNSAVVTGSADSSGSQARSFLETGIFMLLVAGQDGAQIDFNYEFTGNATASTTDLNEFAEAISSFLIEDLITEIAIDGAVYAANTVSGPPADDGIVSGSFSVVLSALADKILNVDVTAGGTATVPEPTIIALMSLGLAGIGYGRFRRKKTA